MGAIRGVMDEAALAALARGERGAIELATVAELWGVCLQAGHGGAEDLPVGLRHVADGATDDANRYRVLVGAGDAPAVAVAHPRARPTRWAYLGAIVGGGDRRRGALIFLDAHAVRDWYDRWREPALTSAVGGAVRYVARAGQPWVTAVLVDAGPAPIGVYLGFDDAGDDAVAVVLDAAGLGGLRDDRDGEEGLRAAQAVLADAGPGPCTVPLATRFEDFVPNLVDGVPRFERSAGLPATVTLTGTAVTTLPLPSGQLGGVLCAWAVDGQVASAWPAAGDRAEVLAFHGPAGGLEGWVVRVAGVRPVRWLEVGFEDACVLGDGAGGGGTDDRALAITDDGWPDDDLGLARSATGAPVLCVRGPDLAVARGLLGLDADGRVATLVVVG